MKIQLDWPQYFIEPRVEAELIRNAGTRFKASSLARFDFVNPVSYTHLTLPTICSV